MFLVLFEIVQEQNNSSFQLMMSYTASTMMTYYNREHDNHTLSSKKRFPRGPRLLIHLSHLMFYLGMEERGCRIMNIVWDSDQKGLIFLHRSHHWHPDYV